MAKEYAAVVGGAEFVEFLTARFIEKLDFDATILNLFLFMRRRLVPLLKRYPEHPELNASFGDIRNASDLANVVKIADAAVNLDGLACGAIRCHDENKSCLGNVAITKPQVDPYRHRQAMMLRFISSPEEEEEEAVASDMWSKKAPPYFSWFVAIAGPSMLSV